MYVYTHAHAFTHSIYFTFYFPGIVFDTVRAETNVKDKNLAHLVFIMAAEG